MRRPDDTALTPLELASGMPVGEGGASEPVVGEPSENPLETLEASILPALRRPPCLVAFSGGRDSSAILAVATRLARRVGVPDPIPFSFRFSAHRETDETAWQELVVAALRIVEWTRVEAGDRVGVLGPIAQSVLRRHGVLWPPNSHLVVPVLEAARGGSVLTGVDGDGLFGAWRWGRARAVLAGVERPSPRDLRPVLAFALPRPFHRRRARRMPIANIAWLRPGPRDALIEAFAAQRSTEPRNWADRVQWWARRRYLALFKASLHVHMVDRDAELHTPFLVPDFIASIARYRDAARLSSRTAAMRSLFSGLLPDEVLARSGKASFTSAYWDETARRFTSEWDGSGLDEGLVQPDILRGEWGGGPTDFRSTTPLQAAWLAGDRDAR